MQVVNFCPDGLHAIQKGYVPWQQVCMKGGAALEVTEDIDNGVRKYTSKLVFSTSEMLDADVEPMAYRLHLTDGNTMLLMGLSQQPFPLRTIADTREKQASGKSVIQHTVTWTSMFAPLTLLYATI